MSACFDKAVTMGIADKQIPTFLKGYQHDLSLFDMDSALTGPPMRLIRKEELDGILQHGVEILVDINGPSKMLSKSKVKDVMAEGSELEAVMTTKTEQEGALLNKSFIPILSQGTVRLDQENTADYASALSPRRCIVYAFRAGTDTLGELGCPVVL